MNLQDIIDSALGATPRTGLAGSFMSETPDGYVMTPLGDSLIDLPETTGDEETDRLLKLLPYLQRSQAEASERERVLMRNAMRDAANLKKEILAYEAPIAAERVMLEKMPEAIRFAAQARNTFLPEVVAAPLQRSPLASSYKDVLNRDYFRGRVA